MLYLGVDGGGTKTAFALIDERGQVLAEHQEKTCYHITVGIDGAKNVLENGINQIFNKVGATVNDLTFSFFGLPAYGEDTALLATLDKLPSTFIPENLYRCDNDMVTGWAAAFDCEDGINIVSGTGSIAYGENNGSVARCGGWGELFSDEGSAYWVGRKGLMTFAKMSDGRLSKGPLYEILKQSLDITQDLDVSGLVHSEWQGERSKIAAISTIVSQAATAGDSQALNIFDQAGKELALIVEGTKNTLNYEVDEAINVSYSGGIFSAQDLILNPFTTALLNYSPHYHIQTPKFTPVIGAARYARKLSN